ncbi:MAG: DUF4175 domain-containing protein [Neomegalonema sp.]|nr:DUF4175 domain-containing protein [Neomegalonema sp.]
MPPSSATPPPLPAHAQEVQEALRGVAARLDRQTSRAQLSLFLDRLSSAAWPVLAALLSFVALTYAGLWSWMPDWTRLVVLLVLAGGVIWGLWRIWQRAHWPSRDDARSWLDEGFPDRPVQSFDDAQAIGRSDARSQSLWRAHQRRVAAAAARIRARGPKLAVERGSDPFALRYFSALALGGALLMGSGSSSDLADAFAPVHLTDPVAQPPMRVEMWATPPAYTGLAPLYFADAVDRVGAHTLPSGTQLAIRVFDAGSTPSLTQSVMDQDPNEGKAPSAAQGSDEQGAELQTVDEQTEWARSLTLTQSGSVTVQVEGHSAEPLIALDLTVTPDSPPTVSWGKSPERGAQGVTQFSYSAEDDYGISEARLELRLDPEAQRASAPEPQDAMEVELALPLPATEDGTIPQTPVEVSLAGHPWVGLPVIMTLIVEDGAGQQARSEPLALDLIGRRFSEPMAKALMEERGNLAWNQADAPRVGRVLSALTRYPDDYFDNAGAYLLIRSAISRLSYAIEGERVGAERPGILDLLYEAAVKLEDGDLQNAAERLARAQRQLKEAIENGASEEEIAELTEELRQAVADYMRALQALAENNPEMAEDLPQDSQSISQDQIEEMIRAIEEAMAKGEYEKAAEMQAMLQQLLESMRPGGQTQQAGEGEGQQQGEEREPGPVDDLNDMIGEQQDLAERSYDAYRGRPPQDAPSGQQQGQPQNGQQQPGQGQPQSGQGQPQPGQGQQGQQGQGQQGQGQQGQQSQNGQGQNGDGQNGEGQPQQPGNQSGSQGGRNAQRGGGEGGLQGIERRQRELRDALRSFRSGENGQLGGDEAARAFEEAERSMREAERSLREGDAGRAAEEQMRAVDALRDGARSAIDELAERERQEREARGESEGEGAQGDANSKTQRDPFGREAEAGINGRGHRPGEQYVPGEIDKTRSRELRDEIMRRSGERERPREELDYYDRLLDDF